MQTASVELNGHTRYEDVLVAQGLERNDDELLDQLIVQHGHRLLRYLLYLTSNRETAEDLFQETWMRVLRGAKFKGNSRFDTWLFKVARNLVFDMNRKRTVISLDEMNEKSDADQSLDFAADDPSPFERYHSEERAQQVAEVLVSLVPLYREAIVLRFYEELSLEEIAQVTQAPLSTVKTRLYRGLAEARRRILANEKAKARKAQESIPVAS